MNQLEEIRKARLKIIEEHLVQTGNKKCNICKRWMNSQYISEDGTCDECNPKEVTIGI